MEHMSTFQIIATGILAVILIINIATAIITVQVMRMNDDDEVWVILESFE